MLEKHTKSPILAMRMGQCVQYVKILLLVRLDCNNASVGIVLKLGELNASSVVDSVRKLAIVIEQIPLTLVLND